MDAPSLGVHGKFPAFPQLTEFIHSFCGVIPKQQSDRAEKKPGR
jgi:hypothetical protein